MRKLASRTNRSRSSEDLKDGVILLRMFKTYPYLEGLSLLSISTVSWGELYSLMEHIITIPNLSSLEITACAARWGFHTFRSVGFQVDYYPAHLVQTTSKLKKLAIRFPPVEESFKRYRLIFWKSFSNIGVESFFAVIKSFTLHLPNVDTLVLGLSGHWNEFFLSKSVVFADVKLSLKGLRHLNYHFYENMNNWPHTISPRTYYQKQTLTVSGQFQAQKNDWATVSYISPKDIYMKLLTQQSIRSFYIKLALRLPILKSLRSSLLNRSAKT